MHNTALLDQRTTKLVCDMFRFVNSKVFVQFAVTFVQVAVIRGNLCALSEPQKNLTAAVERKPFVDAAQCTLEGQHDSANEFTAC